MAQAENAPQQQHASSTHSQPPPGPQLPVTPTSPGQEQWAGKEEAWQAPKPPTRPAPGTPSSDITAQFEHNRELSDGSIQHTTPESSPSSVHISASVSSRKAVPSTLVQHGPELRVQGTPASPVSISPPQFGLIEGETASINQYLEDESRRHSGNSKPDSAHLGDPTPLPIRTTSSKQSLEQHEHSRHSSFNKTRIDEDAEYHVPPEDLPDSPALQYHHSNDIISMKKRVSQMTAQPGSSSSSDNHRRSQSGSDKLGIPAPRTGMSRPASAYTLGSDLRGRTLSPLRAQGSDQSPGPYGRDLSSSRRSPSVRPVSYVDLLNNLPYSQQIAPGTPLNNASLQSTVGSAASLLHTKKTLDMYRANVKKTKDPAIQYEFAIFMINAAAEALPGDGIEPTELQHDAKHILQGLANQAYPFAQYYLGDGYFSGMFNKGKPDHDKAFPLFVAASKHGHAEAGYRAALCYEFGWGTAKSYPKAVQFYRNSASKNHPGAATRLGLACVRDDMGLKNTYREGLKWLRRAQESADFQYNAGPYELGLMHLTGFGGDIFKDEAYAAQLLTQSAELGHVHANFLMGQAYENGLYSCPRDAALSVHFYNGAATRGHVEGMMALCAWYLIGAKPVLEKDEAEAFAWAKQAAETGYAKAEYAVGYFTEVGIGCRRDPLEANMWYVRAADQGNETATQRLAITRAAASGDPGIPMGKTEARAKELHNGAGGGGKKKFMGIF